MTISARSLVRLRIQDTGDSTPLIVTNKAGDPFRLRSVEKGSSAAINYDGESGTIKSCDFFDNSAEGHGGALSLEGLGDPSSSGTVISHSSFAGNRSSYGDAINHTRTRLGTTNRELNVNDGDDQQNAEEARANTHPNDPNSYFEISDMTTGLHNRRDSRTFTLTFPSVPEQEYHFLFSQDLVRWEHLESITARDGDSTKMTLRTPLYGGARRR